MGRLGQLLAALRGAVSTTTALGWTVAGLAVLAWIVGARWGWEEFLVVAGAALVLIVMAIGFTFGRHNISTSISVQPARVTVGERAAGVLELQNLRQRAVRALRVELPVGKAVAVFGVPRLGGGESTDELFVVPTNRRAIIPVGPVTTVKGDPLGLFRRTHQWSDVHEIFVHPRTTRLSTIAAGLIRDLEGQTTNALSPSDIAFHTLREYTSGDDMRHVHWKSSAKIGELMVRQYNDTRRSHVAVLLSTDLDEYGSDDELELAISCAASVAVQAIRDEQTITMIAGDTQFATGNVTRLLDRFSGIEGARGVGSIATGLQMMRRLAPDASVAVVCVGSRLDVPAVRGAVSRAAVEVGSVVLRADLGADASYLTVGSSTFVNVPDLDSLHRSLGAAVRS